MPKSAIVNLQPSLRRRRCIPQRRVAQRTLGALVWAIWCRTGGCVGRPAHWPPAADASLPDLPLPTPEANPTPDRAAGGKLRAPCWAGPSVVVQDRADPPTLA